MTRITDIISYEEGDMDEEEQIVFMQDMIDSGQVWRMQGSYGRAAMDMIEAGLCVLGEQGRYDYYGNYVPSRFEVKPGTKGSLEYAEKMMGGE